MDQLTDEEYLEYLKQGYMDASEEDERLAEELVDISYEANIILEKG